MIRLQRLALATRAVAAIPPAAARAAWPLLQGDPNDSLKRLAGILEAKVVEKLTFAFARLDDVERAVGAWDRSGIRVLLWEDADYPARWLERLGGAAPLAIFLWGDATALQRSAIGVVGSRDVSEQGRAFACDVGVAAAQAGLAVVSGGAGGVDTAAVEAARSAGGPTIEICAGSILKRINRLVRAPNQAILSALDPAAPFSVGAAMARNKLIYGLAEMTVVVESALGSGGTWAGAVESLTKGYGRVAAWRSDGAGTSALIERGAEPVISSAQAIKSLEFSPQKSLF